MSVRSVGHVCLITFFVGISHQSYAQSMIPWPFSSTSYHNDSKNSRDDLFPRLDMITGVNVIATGNTQISCKGLLSRSKHVLNAGVVLTANLSAYHQKTNKNYFLFELPEQRRNSKYSTYFMVSEEGEIVNQCASADVRYYSFAGVRYVGGLVDMEIEGPPLKITGTKFHARQTIEADADLMQRAKDGDPDAAALLSDAYYSSKPRLSSDGDIWLAKAIDGYRAKVDAGDSDAILKLGKLYVYTKEKIDSKAAETLLTPLADTGNMDAMRALSDLYKKDGRLELADRLLTTLASKGDQSAITYIQKKTEKAKLDADRRDLQARIEKEQLARAADELKLVKVIGTKICKTFGGTEQQVSNVNMPVGFRTYHTVPILGVKTDQNFIVTAFTEDAVGKKLKVRIGGLKTEDGKTFDKLGGDVELKPGSIIWDDASNWRPC